ncbi:hypothetical protein [Paracraurococcus lichenis]|uniref:CopG family transcriptional regulator n=1 Tax=Paracraurococcus lichenis TaxID=3064888 RepID=A0ABT9EAC3_9PROT|nr:hypothetical protein [Paracraurococcus sp. LOR1-02]MDO9713152.1 hypothetical protein [Paracraurococcus sp. LOR1-02]
MGTRNVSRLDAGLIARKGEAAPASSGQAPAASPAPAMDSPPEPPPGLPEENAAAATHATPAALPRGLQGTIAVTVRLDPARYERMRIFGVRRRRTNQQILVEALDGYLDANAE